MTVRRNGPVGERTWGNKMYTGEGGGLSHDLPP